MLNVDWMNTDTYVHEPLCAHDLDDLVAQYKSIVTAEERNNTFGLRPSLLGKPAVELFAQRFKPEWYADGQQITERLHRLFTAGFLFELEFKRLLYRRGNEYGLTIHEEQIPVQCSNVLRSLDDISGTADFILDYHGERYLVDTKTTSDESFRRMTTGTLPREYVVQLAVYEAALRERQSRIDRVGLIIQKKSNSEIAWVEIPREQLDEGLEHARAVVKMWDDSSTWEEAIENGLEPPDPTPEVYRKKQTGRYLVPASMRYSEILEHCYELSEENNDYGKPTLYVLSKLFGGDN